MLARYRDTEYFCTPYGEVYRKMKDKYRPMKSSPDRGGYQRIGISINGKSMQKFVHRMVFESWVHEIPEGLYVDHLDFDVRNNNISNLRLLTKSENSKRKKIVRNGQLNPKSIMSDEVLIKCFESMKLPRNSRSKYAGVSARQIRRAVNGETHKSDSIRLGLIKAIPQ